MTKPTFVCLILSLVFSIPVSCTFGSPLQPNSSPISVTTNYLVTTLAGSGNAAYAEGTGSSASFNTPSGVAVDGGGNVFVADTYNHCIRKITAGGVVTTLAGSGSGGYGDGSGASASFWSPGGVAVDGGGNLYVADTGNNRIRKITSSGDVSTLAGSGGGGFADGTGTSAVFLNPSGVAVDGAGNVFVADYYNYRIRQITNGAAVTTLAGFGAAGYVDDAGSAARFQSPAGVAVGAGGIVFVADFGNHCLRKITSGGAVTTFAGAVNAGSADGAGPAARFNNPYGLALDGAGNLYVGDQANHRIRKISTDGVVTTLAGSGTAAYADGAGLTASFNKPSGVAADAAGNLYVADANNHRIRKMTRILTTN